MRLDQHVYERGGELVRLAEGRIYPVSEPWLTVYLTGVARFEKYDGRFKSYRAVDAPEKLSKQILAQQGL